MSHRAAQNEKPVSLFPFLAVLLCTMGALLVLLVVLAEQAARKAPGAAVVASADVPAPGDADRPALPSALLSEALTKGTSLMADSSGADKDETAHAELERLNERRDQLQKLANAVNQRMQNEKAQLSHVEDHSRRLEHELAIMSLANDQLKAASEDRNIDQEQAERELTRLKELIADSEKQVNELKEEAATARKSYAIVPYRGPNGTFRPPVYIECRKGQVVIQPAGIKLTKADYAGTLRPGNAIASAVRAAQSHQAQQAKEEENDLLSGENDGEPYPLIIARANARNEYESVKHALVVADMEYGYEMVTEDVSLEYPIADPRLSIEQNHAVQQARIRQARLAKAAPRLVRRTLPPGRGGRSSSDGSSFGGGSRAANVSGGSGGSGDGPALGRAAGGETFAGSTIDGQPGGGNGQPGGGDLGNGNPQGIGSAGGLSGEPGGSQNLNRGDHYAASGGGSTNGPYGGAAGGSVDNSNGSHYGGAGSSSGGLAAGGAGGTGSSGQSQGGAAGNGGAGSNGATGGTSQMGSAPSGGQAGASASAMARSSGGTASGGASGSPSQETASSEQPTDQVDRAMDFRQAAERAASASGNRTATAETTGRGADWALNKTLGQSVAMRRPIRVVVKSAGMALLPNPEPDGTYRRATKNVSFNQSTQAMLDDFAEKVRQHTSEWGFAGRGLNWRPVLMLQVDPQAQPQADRLVQLLENSGVDVQYSQTAQRPAASSARNSRSRSGGPARVTR